MAPAAPASARPPARWPPSCWRRARRIRDGARARVRSGAHPDLTWVAPSGAHEILVSDIDGPVVAAASKTPFEASCRVFVIERVDELGDEAANRMLKTLEEPASFVHLILLTDAAGRGAADDPLALPAGALRRALGRARSPASARGSSAWIADTALACARLSLATPSGRASWPARRGGAPRRRPRAVRARGVVAGEALGARAVVGACWRGARAGRGACARSSRPGPPPSSSSTRARSASGSRPSGPSASGASRRRVETGALDLALQVVSLWFADLALPGVGRRGAGPQRRPPGRAARPTRGRRSGRAAGGGRAGRGHPRCASSSTSPRSWRAKRSRTAWSDCWRCEHETQPRGVPAAPAGGLGSRASSSR